MIPIHDNNPTHTRPVVTMGLIGLNVVIFLGQSIQPDGGETIIWKYGYLPALLRYDAAEVRAELQSREGAEGERLALDRRTGRVVVVRERPHADVATAVPGFVRMITCMFLHGGWMHLLGNMLYLWVFGNNIEDRLGPGIFLAFYLVTGIFGTLAHAMLDAQGLVPLVGASGAISGVLGAYILVFPHARVLTIVPIGWYITQVMLPAWVFLGIYALLQIIQGLPALSRVEGGGVAYWAHIGGFAAGLALIKLLPQKRYAMPAVRWARPVNEDSGWVKW